MLGFLMDQMFNSMPRTVQEQQIEKIMEYLFKALGNTNEKAVAL